MECKKVVSRGHNYCLSCGISKSWIDGKRQNQKYSKKICSICNNEFIPNNPVQIYCSKKCSEIGKKKLRKIRDLLHKNELKEKRLAYCLINKDKIYKKKHLWYLKNKKRLNKEKVKYHSNRLKKDISFRIREILRHRFLHALNGYTKYNSILKLLGCSINELKNHLESKFKPGMSWKNYGYHGWHIDHIKPCASFDLSKPSQQRKCFHYTNLQPLWAEENLRKSNKLI